MDFTEAYPDRCSSVGVAARLGDTKALKELIATGACIDIHDNRGWTPLHEAAHANHYECVQILLGAEIDDEDVNVRTWEGETALFFAARNGNKKMIRQLIQHGGKLNICNNEDNFPIQQAVAGNHHECVDILLQKGADVNLPQCNGWSLLHEAAYHGFASILLQLLKAGAKTDVGDDYGIVPVFTAAQYGHLDCLKLLIEYGSDPNATADDNATPLYLAAQEGYSGCLEYLLQHGASAEIATAADGHVLSLRPIHAAAAKGHVRCLELLIPQSLSVLEMSSYVQQSATPLHLAAMKGHNEAVQVLLKAGCDPDYGARNPSKQLAERLLASDEKSYEPPCLCAIEHSHYNVARTLLASGARICDHRANLCLMSLFHGDTDATVFLLDQGADIGCQHMRSVPLSGISGNLQYLRCLLQSGLRWRFNCQDKCSLCCKHWKGVSTHAWASVIKLIFCYVDRLNLCKHSINKLQQYSEWHEILALTGKPHSLYHLSRVAITEHLGTSLAPKIIPKMDFLPRLVRDYLLYE